MPYSLLLVNTFLVFLVRVPSFYSYFCIICTLVLSFTTWSLSLYMYICVYVYMYRIIENCVPMSQSSPLFIGLNYTTNRIPYDIVRYFLRDCLAICANAAAALALTSCNNFLWESNIFLLSEQTCMQQILLLMFSYTKLHISHSLLHLSASL